MQLEPDALVWAGEPLVACRVTSWESLSCVTPCKALVRSPTPFVLEACLPVPSSWDAGGPRRPSVLGKDGSFLGAPPAPGRLEDSTPWPVQTATPGGAGEAMPASQALSAPFPWAEACFAAEPSIWTPGSFPGENGMAVQPHLTGEHTAAAGASPPGEGESGAGLGPRALAASLSPPDAQE